VSAHIYAAVRTPFGRLGGALAGIRPDDLAATALSGLLARAPGLDPHEIGDVAHRRHRSGRTAGDTVVQGGSSDWQQSCTPRLGGRRDEVVSQQPEGF
jgi:acetyl-CoA acetyltransferase